jgi:hypothetical protein
LIGAGYSPLIQLPDGTILNAPHVAVASANGTLSRAPKVKALGNGKVTLDLTPGFSDGKPIVYISTDASDPLAATLENVPYVPAMADVPEDTLIDLVAFTNGQTGKANPQRQGLTSAIQDGMSPLNIAANVPDSPAYSPLWAVNLAKWVTSPAGPRQTSVDAVRALSNQGQVASFNPNDPASKAPLAPSGIIVNCPIIGEVASNASGGADAGVQSGETNSTSAGSGGECQASDLGYQCVYTGSSGIKIHHSRGGGVPSNGCTSRTDMASPQNSMMSRTELLHFAVEGPATQVGLGIYAYPGCCV